MQPRPATAADGPDYLTLPLAWTATRRFDHGRVSEHRLALGGGEVAILQLVADRAWAMTIVHGSRQPDTDRGLFGTPHDALMVLVAEFVFPGHLVEHLEVRANAPPEETREPA